MIKISTIGSKIREARERKGLLQSDLAKLIGVKSAGVISNWEKDLNKPNADKMIEICEALDITPAYLLNYRGKGEPLSYSREASKLADAYDNDLDRWGRQAVRELMETEVQRCKDESQLKEAPIKEEPKVIHLYSTPAAAGYVSPIFGDDFKPYELKPEDPQGAVFAVKVSGDSMHPYFPDGSIVFCNKDPIADGEIGVFCLDGDSFIKQYHYDRVMGMTYLFSLNRERADADKLVTRSSGQTLTCLGRVMTRRRFPLPGRW